jgi:hypothetical protein
MPLLNLLAVSLLTAADPAAEELRAAARAWEARDRTELARQSLEKLAALRSVRPDDLLQLGETDLKQADLDSARTVLERLQRVYADSSEARTLAIELRVMTADRVALAAIRREVETGHTAGVRDALHRLFPDGVPNGILGIEVCELLAASPEGRAAAEAGLIDLVRRHPRDLRYTVALARQLSRHATTARLAVRLLEPLKGRPDVRRADLNEALDRAQATLASAPADTVEAAMPELEPWLAPAPAPAPAQAAARATTPPVAAATSSVIAAASAQTPAPSDTFGTAAEPTGDASDAPVSAVSVWDRYRTARAARAAGDARAAEAAIRSLEAAAATSEDAAFARALIAEATGDRAAARQWVERIPASSGGEGLAALRTRLSAITLPEPMSSLPIDLWSGGLNFTHKPGDAGVSALTTVTVPLEWRHTLADHSSLGLMLEAVSLDAGPLPRDPAVLSGLGSVAVSGLGTAAGSSTHTAGIALGVAWYHQDLVIDIGSTPLGFAVTHLIGGVRYAPTVGALDTRVEVFRRPVTSSLLSFAGRVDPGTGRVWGGVTESGAAARVGHYTADHSLSLSIRLTDLDGSGVIRNRRLAARLAGDHTVATWFGGALSFGGTLSFDAYDRNLLGYTLGSGGYFSPQSYTALALPLEWSRRGALNAVRVRLAPTVTHRHDASAPWYPLDPALMTTAVAAGQIPVTSAGTADAASIALSIVAEWRVSGGVVGMSFAHDRADYYRPVSLSVYYRPGVAPGAAYAPLQPYLDY